MNDKEVLLKHLLDLDDNCSCGFETGPYYGDMDEQLYDVVFYFESFGGFVFETRECHGAVCKRIVYESSEELLSHIKLDKFTYTEDFNFWW